MVGLGASAVATAVTDPGSAAGFTDVVDQRAGFGGSGGPFGGGEPGWNNAWKILAGPSLEVEKLGPCSIALGIAEAAMAEA